MISLFLVVPAPRVRRAWDLMRTLVRIGLRFFLSFGKKYFFYRSFLINNLFGNVFQTLRVAGLITLLWNPDDKKYLLGKMFFSLTVHRKPIFITSAFFQVLAYFSLFKLIQLVSLVMEWWHVRSLKRIWIESSYIVSRWFFAFTRKSLEEVLRRLKEVLRTSPRRCRGDISWKTSWGRLLKDVLRTS